MQPSKVILLFQQTMWMTSNCFYSLDLILFLHCCAMFFCLHATPGGWIEVRVFLDTAQVVLLLIINQHLIVKCFGLNFSPVPSRQAAPFEESVDISCFSSALIALRNLHGKRSLTEQAELWVESGAHAEHPGEDVSPPGKAPWPSFWGGHENTT